MEKTATTLSSLFGLTHKQMSLLLQVSRSQWSMHELGKRGLPLHAREFLTEMIGYVKLEDKGLKVQQQRIEQEKAKKEQLEKQLRRNEYDQYEIDKKVEFIESRYMRNLAAIGFVEYLTIKPNLKHELNTDLLGVISSEAERTLKKCGLAELTCLLVKQELLHLEKLLLGSALNKATRTLEKLSGEQLSSDY